MKFSKFEDFFQSKKLKINKKAKNIFRDRPARWRARRTSFNSRMRLAKGFFLPILAAGMSQFFCRPASGTASDSGSLEETFGDQK